MSDVLNTPAKFKHLHQELTTQLKTNITNSNHSFQEGTHKQSEEFDYFAFTQKADKSSNNSNDQKWTLTENTYKERDGINYREKTYELMNEIVKLRILESGYKIEIETLRNKIINQNIENEKLLARIGCNKLSEIYEIVSSQSLLQDKNKKITQSNQEMKKIISHYKHKEIEQQVEREIDEYQSEFAKKVKAKPKSTEQLKLEAFEEENENLTSKLTYVQKQNEEFKFEISKLKRNLLDLEMGIKNKKEEQTNEGEKYETNNENSKNYQIEHKQNESKQNIEKKEFSFGRGRGSEPDFDSLKEPFEGRNNFGMDENINDRIIEMEMNLECYKASIDGLLEENKKLKQSFESLYKMKQGETISNELLKEINIMKSIIELNGTLEEKM